MFAVINRYNNNAKFQIQTDCKRKIYTLTINNISIKCKIHSEIDKKNKVNYKECDNLRLFALYSLQCVY